MKTNPIRGSSSGVLLALALVACGKEQRTPVVSGSGKAPAPTQAEAARTPDPKAAELVEVDGGAEARDEKNVLFVVDGSGSMDYACDGQVKIETARIAGREFLATLDESVRIGLICFYGGKIYNAVPLGLDNRAEFLAALDGLSPSGGTPLTASILRGLDALALQRDNQLGYGHFKVVAVTDGENTAGPEIQAAVDRSLELKIPIFTIGLCVGGNHALNQDPRYYRDANNVSELKRGLQEALAETTAFDATVFEQE